MGDIMERFWKKWIKADYMDRLKIIEGMVEKRKFDEMMNLDKKRSSKNFPLTLNGYFEDLAYVAEREAVKDKDKEITGLKRDIAKQGKLFRRLEEVVKGGL